MYVNVKLLRFRVYLVRLEMYSPANDDAYMHTVAAHEESPIFWQYASPVMASTARCAPVGIDGTKREPPPVEGTCPKRVLFPLKSEASGLKRR